MCTEATENDVRKRTVHGLAHDIGQNGTRRPNEGSDDGEERVIQHEPFSAECKTRVAIQVEIAQTLNKKHSARFRTLHHKNGYSKKKVRDGGGIRAREGERGWGRG